MGSFLGGVRVGIDQWRTRMSAARDHTSQHRLTLTGRIGLRFHLLLHRDIGNMHLACRICFNVHLGAPSRFDQEYRLTRSQVTNVCRPVSMGRRAGSKKPPSLHQLDLWMGHVLGLAADNSIAGFLGSHYHPSSSSAQLPRHICLSTLAWKLDILDHHASRCCNQHHLRKILTEDGGLPVRICSPGDLFTRSQAHG